MPGLVGISCPATLLAPNQSETCTATYTTTQADVDRGGVANTGQATGTPPAGPVLIATNTLTIPAITDPAITVQKTAAPGTFSTVGTKITYSYLVTNAGNVTLDPVVVTDPMPGLVGMSCPATLLAPNDSETCTATYTTTQADLDNGQVQNTGTATGTAPGGPNGL